jgi:hypothetical protein
MKPKPLESLNHFTVPVRVVMFISFVKIRDNARSAPETKRCNNRRDSNRNGSKRTELYGRETNNNYGLM